MHCVIVILLLCYLVLCKCYACLFSVSNCCCLCCECFAAIFMLSKLSSPVVAVNKQNWEQTLCHTSGIATIRSHQVVWLRSSVSSVLYVLLQPGGHWRPLGVVVVSLAIPQGITLSPLFLFLFSLSFGVILPWYIYIRKRWHFHSKILIPARVPGLVRCCRPPACWQLVHLLTVGVSTLQSTQRWAHQLKSYVLFSRATIGRRGRAAVVWWGCFILRPTVPCLIPNVHSLTPRLLLNDMYLRATST